MRIDNGNVNHQNLSYVSSLLKTTRENRRSVVISSPAVRQLNSHLVVKVLSPMSRFARQALFAWLLALYGSVSLCGIGLHALLETGPSHHDHGQVEEKLSTISGVSTHCPLCEFQAQGQLPTAKPRPACRPLDVPHVPIHLLSPMAANDTFLRHPRAPPSSRSDTRLAYLLPSAALPGFCVLPVSR